jgi:hypothetical protein
MSLKHRLKKLEKAIGTLPCSICREWWQQPIVIRDETDPPVPRDPDLCPSCGRQYPKDRIFEIVICEQVVPPQPFMEVV